MVDRKVGGPGGATTEASLPADNRMKASLLVSRKSMSQAQLVFHATPRRIRSLWDTDYGDLARVRNLETT